MRSFLTMRFMSTYVVEAILMGWMKLRSMLCESEHAISHLFTKVRELYYIGGEPASNYFKSVLFLHACPMRSQLLHLLVHVHNCRERRQKACN